MTGGGSPETGRRILLPVLLFLLCPAGLDGAIGCPELPDGACLCDSRKGSNQLGGWEISCTEDGYRIVYEIRKSLTLECSSEDPKPPYAPAMFERYNLSDVDHVKIVMCPQPANLTLSQLLEGVRVRKLKFEGDMPGISFDSDSFRGLTSLHTLNLATNRLESVPADMLANLTLLRDLDMKDNALETLPESLFRDQADLVRVQLSNNRLRELPSGIFANMTKLGSLYLFKNRLQELPDGIFLGLKSLKVLDLAKNEIRELHPELFLDTPQLVDLNFRENNLTRLQGDLFQGTKHLEKLSLSDNRLTKLPENLLEGLGSLKNVYLDNCNLKGIGEAFFSYAVNLTGISMDRNKLTSIPQGLFEKNGALEKISMMYNDILELPGNIFDKNFQLRTLKITHNNLTSLPAGILDHLTHLEVLDLTGNALKTLDGKLLLQNQNLTELHASKNGLTDLQGNRPFGLSSELKVVDLSDNGLSSLSDDINWSVYLKLEKLNLQNNNLTLLKVPDLVLYNANGAEIDLTNNRIRLVQMDMVVWLEDVQENTKDRNPSKTTKIDLKGNPLNCDCRLLGFANYVSRHRPRRLVEFGDLEDLECRDPAPFSGVKLKELRPEDFVCPVTEGCPRDCSCVKRPHGRALLVNCSRLRNLPDTLPPGTTEVHLEDNHIDDLEGLGSDVWRNVTGLYLDRNNNTVGDWHLPPNLTVLSLTGNRLEYLPQSLTDYLEGNPDVRAYLGDNPWICDCETLHIRDWLTDNKRKVADSERMHCGHPVLQNGTEVRTTVPKLRDDVCPEAEPADAGHLITVSAVCVVLAVLLFVVSVLYYRNKQTVIAYFYIHFHHVFVCMFDDEDLDEDKTFDAFVSYSSADRDVAMELLAQLEGGDPAFKLCIHERDWLPGNLISWNIVNSVQNSRKTILVLSKHFLESVWFQVEFHTAYYQMLEDRIDRLIVVVRGDLPEKGSLDKDLQCLLSTKTFLQWGERWFWEKLRYALPHRRGRGPGAPKCPPPPLQDKSFPLRQRPDPGLLKTAEHKIATLSGDGVFSSPKRDEGGARTNGGFQDTQVTVPEVPPNGTKAQSRRFNAARLQNGQAPPDVMPA